MKKIIIAVLAITAGSAYAADFAGLQTLKATDIAVAAESGKVTVPAPTVETGIETLRRLGAEVTDMQVKYRAAELADQMSIKPSLEALLVEYADCQARLLRGEQTCASLQKGVDVRSGKAMRGNVGFAVGAEVSYVRANLIKKLDAKFTSLCAAEGLGGDLAPAKIAELYRKAVEAIKKERDPAAPSAKAFDTLVYVAERLTWIFDGAAETAADAGDFERLAAPPAQRILESVLNADSLALMRSDADIIASQFLNNR